jgi:molybdate transport system substrate-binding protein
MRWRLQVVEGTLYPAEYSDARAQVTDMPFRTLRSWLAVAAALGVFMPAFAPAGAAGAVDRDALRLAQTASPPPASEKSIVLFAAASLTDVLGEISNAYKAQYGVEVKSSFAASSVLARQIEGGARADVFFSADEEWMDYLTQRKLVQSQTRADVVGNQLVLIAPASSKVTAVDIKPGFSLTKELGPRGRLATGDPDSVPVGKYAQAALTKLGAWDDHSKKLVRAENVRAALAYVARGEAALGIVYSTDALAEKRVKVVGTFPADSHPPIRYPVAATNTATSDGVRFAVFVRGAESREIFKKYGFEPVK